MRHITTFEEFLNEGLAINKNANQALKLNVKTELSYGKINTPIYFFVGDSSPQLFDAFGKNNRKEIEKFQGVPYDEVVADFEKIGGDEANDAVIATTVNVASTDHIYAWLNGTRIAQKCKEGKKEVVLAQSLADVCFQLANHVICKTYKSTKDLDWVKKDGLTKEWEDYSNTDKKGMVPLTDLQNLTAMLVEQLTVVYADFMSKYGI
jgi:hypothetical protein